MVLGHNFSSCSLAASKVYLKSRIPAITGSATAENITQKMSGILLLHPITTFRAAF